MDAVSGIMRITGGDACGQRLQSPADKGVRPTADKVRAAIFNVLANHINFTGCFVADVCCGSGALGLEALSRGAHSCLFIDNTLTALDLARRNAQQLGFLSRCQFVCADAVSGLIGQKMDLVLLDPPYSQSMNQAWVDQVMATIAHDTVVVYEADRRTPLRFASSWVLMAEKTYGHTRVYFLRNRA